MLEIRTSDAFLDKCKELVKDYTIEHLDKALLSTTLYDGMYYELTYHGGNNAIYLDAYKKFENRVIK